MGGEFAIQARQITKSYGSGSSATPVLHGIDLCVTPGECLFLVGPSGSGKTTLLSILGCVLSADRGSLRLFGEDVTRLSPNEQARLRRERIGFIFQRYHLFDGLKAWENVRVTLDLLGRPRRESKRESLRLLEQVGLKERTHHRIGQLSMGQRQRVAVARALAANPDLILADEPTASLDAESGQNAMDILKRLCTELGKTIIVVTHDPRIYPAADRILTLIDGRISSTDDNPAEVSRQQISKISADLREPLTATA